MSTDFFILMKQELIITAIIFVLLFLKIGKDRSNENILNIVNLLLLINFLSGFFFNREGVLFNDMFKTNALVVLQKNILNLGSLIISLQSYSWLKKHDHVPEFYILILS